MNIAASIGIYGGGPGSGCNGPNCGRPPKALEKVRKGFGTGGFPRGGKAYRAFQILKDGLPHNPAALKKQLGVTAITRVLRQMAEMSSLMGYKVEYRRGMVQMVRKGPTPQGVSPPSPPSKAVPAGGRKTDSPAEAELRAAKIAKKKTLGGGLTKTEVLTFTDGTKAVWKPGEDEGAGRRNIKRGMNIEREVGAWQVGQIVGMKDLLPKAVIDTEVDGERGAMLTWQPGEPAANGWGQERFDGVKDRARAAAFDYVIGNEDRHGMNWVMDGQKIGLIDHGLTFPDKATYYAGNQRFIDKAMTDQDKVADFPSPKDLAGPYVANKDAIGKAMLGVGLTQKAVDGVNTRIDAMAKTKRWDDLPGVGWF